MVDSDSSNIIERFDRGLPSFFKDTTVRYRSTKASGKTTANTIPPSILRISKVKQYTDLADNVLAEQWLRQKLDTKYTSPVLPGVQQNSEAEVVDCSFAYIIIPICSVLLVLFGDIFTLERETTKSEIVEDTDNEDIVPAVDKHSGIKPGALRFDLIFRHRETKQVLLVIEYKRREMIRSKDFSYAIVPLDASQEAIEERKKQAADRDEGSLLKSSGYVFAQQISAYAGRVKCRDVALFNWDHLLLFDFHRLGLDKGRRVGQGAMIVPARDEAKLCWVSEAKTKEPFIEQKWICKALLGWAINKFEAKGVLRRRR